MQLSPKQWLILLMVQLSTLLFGMTITLANVVLLHRGRLIEAGPAKEFFENPRTNDARTFIAGELLI